MSVALQTAAVILIPLLIPVVRKQYSRLQHLRQCVARGYTQREVQQLAIVSLGCVFYGVLALRSVCTPETNVYRATSSRLAVPLEVLKARASRLPSLSVVPWTILESGENVLAYLRLGPRPFVQCQWCTTETIDTFFYYLLGRITLIYAGHLLLLSVCTSSRSVPVVAVLSAYFLEVYARVGGLDEYNARSKTNTDILFIDSFAQLFRHLFFLWTLLCASIKIWVDAKYPTTAPSLTTIRQDMFHAIENLRLANSMNWTTKEGMELRSHVDQFWQRNDEARVKLDSDPGLQEAKASALARQGNPAIARKGTREWIEGVITRLSS